MQFHATRSSVASQRTACAVVGVYEKRQLSAAAGTLDEKCGGLIRRVVRRGDFDGKSGSVLPIADLPGANAERALLVGLGPRAAFGRKAYRKAVAAATEWLSKSGARDAVFYLALEPIPDVDTYYAARFAAETVQSTLYRIPALKSGRKPPSPKLSKVGVAVSDRGELAPARRGLAHGEAIAAGMALTRDLGNLPANVCTPSYLASRARQMARDHKAVRAKIMNEADIKRLKMGAFLSVTRGSEQPPRLIVIEYRGGKPGEAPVALVGKGITFDSGGLSLKPADAQVGMKTDMSGAAVVAAVMGSLADRVPAGIQVTGLLCMAENLPGASATRPGDVVTHHGGLTSEVVNTDAEGRLVLGDGLDFAVRDLAADVVVDIATLTGAATLGLGRRYAALFSNSDVLAQALRDAGEAAGEQMWRMPLHDGYAELISSDVADQANAGRGRGLSPGSITAALFLQRFVSGTAWAHLDIAGPGRSDAERDDLPKGGTGFGARALLRWIEAGAPA